jgi:hypothetical protein
VWLTCRVIGKVKIVWATCRVNRKAKAVWVNCRMNVAEENDREKQDE